MNFSSKHTVSQNTKRIPRERLGLLGATSKAQDSNGKRYVSVGYNKARSKWLFLRPAEGKPSCP